MLDEDDLDCLPLSSDVRMRLDNVGAAHGDGGDCGDGGGGATFYCYEFLALRHLDQEVEEDRGGEAGARLLAGFQSLQKEEKEWYLALFLQRCRGRLKSFAKFVRDAKERESSLLSPPLPSSKQCHLPGAIVNPTTLLSRYLSHFAFTELHLDSVFQQRQQQQFADGTTTNPSFELPSCLFRCCPNLLILSLRSNHLDALPPDVGRLKHLQKLYLTNNRLQNRSVPFTLSFCSSLSELYLDHNLLDALPGFLLRMPRLSVVHRHGNHNYFKATFMWYHTDVNNRILEDPGQQQQQYLGTCGGPEKDPFLENSLQESAALAILAARIDFYQASEVLPPKMQERLADTSRLVSLCDNCSVARHASKPGFKVFTFKNPYLGNTCVPFQHWACSRACAEAIEVPARREQVLSAREQDRLYQMCIRQTVAGLGPSQRAMISPSLETSSEGDEEEDETEARRVAETMKKRGSLANQRESRKRPRRRGQKTRLATTSSPPTSSTSSSAPFCTLV